MVTVTITEEVARAYIAVKGHDRWSRLRLFIQMMIDEPGTPPVVKETATFILNEMDECQKYEDVLVEATVRLGMGTTYNAVLEAAMRKIEGE